MLLYTFESSDKNPLVMSYRSCAYMPANCDAVTYFMRFWLRYDVPDPSSPPELLVVHQSYTVHDQMTYLAPLKHAVVDTDDTMRLQWWAGNEKMKGTPTTYALGPVDKLGHRKFTTPLNNRNGTVLEATSSGGCAGSLVFYGSGNDTDAFEIGVDEDLIMTVTLCTQVTRRNCTTWFELHAISSFTQKTPPPPATASEIVDADGAMATFYSVRRLCWRSL